jgi:hypothetical protein
VVHKGKSVFMPLLRRYLKWRGNVLYANYTSAEDTKRGLNRAENLRPFCEGEPDFRRLFGLREDAESANNLLKSTLWGGRAHSIGVRRQTLNQIGFYVLCNLKAAAAWECRTGRRLGTDPPVEISCSTAA